GGHVVLTGGGAFGQTPSDAIVLHSHGLDLAWSRRALAPHKMRLDGRGSVELKLRGPWADPRLSARGSLEAGSFAGPGLEPIAFERIDAELAYARGQLDIRRATLRQGGREAMVAGTLPVAEGTRGSTAPIDLAVRLEDGNLAIANLFSQGRFQWLGGSGFVELRLGGTPLHPTLAGRIKLRDGRVAAKGLDAPVEKLEADITLADDKVSIETLKGTYGGGDLELGGTITLAEFQPERVDLTAVARPFRLQLTNDYYQGMVEADLKLKGPVAAPQLSGMVALRDGLIALKDTPKPDQGPPKEPLPLRLNNLQIALGPNLRIKNALIDLNVTTQQRQGFLQVDGPISAPKPYGVVIIESGTIRPLNNTFKITEGRVEFFGEQVRTEDELMAILAPDAGADPAANLNAKLDIFARTTLFDYEENEPIDIQAHVTGSLQQMDMRFTSEPIRPQQELLDMLSKKQVLAQTFNGKLDGGQVIVKEVGGLVTSNIEELISPYTLFLRNALSLQTFRVELVPDYEKDSTANIAGFKPALTVETRPLLDRFSVGSRLVVGQLYDTSPTTLGDHSYVGLNWRFNRHLAMQYRVDPYVDQLNQRLLNQTLGLKAQFSY
ncbi:MAG: translocation/assembly module TamB domain-containing protein, partial [Candidatus Sericytochromatia bacterium]